MFRPGAKSGRARSGIFTVGSIEIATPSYVIPTRRGAIPHMTPDHSPQAPIAAIYIEDFWQASPESWRTLPLAAKLRMSLARRPGGNSRPATLETVGITTHQGKKSAKITDIAEMLPCLGDLLAVPYDEPQKWPPGQNRMQKLQKRSAAWSRTFYESRQEKPVLAPYAPEFVDSSIYPEECTAGWVISEPDPFSRLPTDGKARFFGFHFVSCPLEAVRLVEHGIDFIFLCVDELASLGHALTVSWNEPVKGAAYLDLTDERYKQDMSLLNGYPRAYIFHMLECHEMTAQVILQQHNLNVFAALFEQIRSTIEDGTFATKCAEFYHAYS